MVCTGLYWSVLVCTGLYYLYLYILFVFFQEYCFICIIKCFLSSDKAECHTKMIRIQIEVCIPLVTQESDMTERRMYGTIIVFMLTLSRRVNTIVQHCLIHSYVCIIDILFSISKSKYFRSTRIILKKGFFVTVSC